jgi:hypothetical protein
VIRPAITRRGIKSILDLQYRRKANSNPLANFRVAELERLFSRRYGLTLPDDDSGRDDAVIALHHLAFRSDAVARMQDWITRWCPWMPNREALIRRILDQPRRFRAAELGEQVRLTKAERQALRITTIRAIDETARQMAARRRKDHAERERQRRAAAGAKPRSESLRAQAPWAVLGISESTYRRRRKAGPLRDEE